MNLRYASWLSNSHVSHPSGMLRNITQVCPTAVCPAQRRKAPLYSPVTARPCNCKAVSFPRSHSHWVCNSSPASDQEAPYTLLPSSATRLLGPPSPSSLALPPLALLSSCRSYSSIYSSLLSYHPFHMLWSFYRNRKATHFTPVTPDPLNSAS